MQELLAELQEYEGRDVLKVAAYYHARFEYIHPFADGNGRVGRTLLNYHLMTHDHPPIIIHEEDRPAYYRALENYDTEEDLSPLHLFLKQQIVLTWIQTLEREHKRRHRTD
jgi:Fic family protein